MRKDNPSKPKESTKTTPSNEMRMSCEAIIQSHLGAFASALPVEQSLARVKVLTLLSSDSVRVPPELRDTLDALAQEAGVRKLKTKKGPT
jgi:hypothetical protein